jgi:hypothetical protein
VKSHCLRPTGSSSTMYWFDWQRLCRLFEACQGHGDRVESHKETGGRDNYRAVERTNFWSVWFSSFAVINFQNKPAIPPAVFKPILSSIQLIVNLVWILFSLRIV